MTEHRPTPPRGRAVLSLQRLRADYGPGVLAFERENRAWFAASVSDRGDAWFERFGAHLAALLADQEAGRAAFHVLVDGRGAIVGRFNLDPITAGTARVGYRVAESVGGRGVATAALRELCAVATDLGLHTLVAAAAETNAASQRVLLRRGSSTSVEPTWPRWAGARVDVSGDVSTSELTLALRSNMCTAYLLECSSVKKCRPPPGPLAGSTTRGPTKSSGPGFPTMRRAGITWPSCAGPMVSHVPTAGAAAAGRWGRGCGCAPSAR